MIETRSIATCDAPGCAAWTAESPKRHETAERAAAVGWRVVGQRCYCPEHFAMGDQDEVRISGDRVLRPHFIFSWSIEFYGELPEPKTEIDRQMQKYRTPPSVEVQFDRKYDEEEHQYKVSVTIPNKRRDMSLTREDRKLLIAAACRLWGVDLKAIRAEEKRHREERIARHMKIWGCVLSSQP